jgi:hypothetical protein
MEMSVRAEVVIAHGQYSKGHIIPEMPGNVFRTLKARGLVREANDSTKAIAAPVDRMIRANDVLSKVRRRHGGND